MRWRISSESASNERERLLRSLGYHDDDILRIEGGAPAVGMPEQAEHKMFSFGAVSWQAQIAEFAASEAFSNVFRLKT